MRFVFSIITAFIILVACKNKIKDKSFSVQTEISKNPIKYAKGFTIKHYKTHKEITITSPWPKSKESFKYLLIDEGQAVPEHNASDIVIQLPINKIVVMSTTNIPALEYLGVDEKLVGFPNTRLISSKKTRARIDNGEIKDLNNALEMNMELLLDLKPDLVVGFSVNGGNKKLDQIQKFGIPLVLDGAWTETDPLGRAEWIKFIAAFFNKREEANKIFNDIEFNYLETKKLVAQIEKKPTVFSGVMFKDIWYVPGGKSFVAKFLEDAKTNYIWKNDNSNGSLQLNFENVLEKANRAKLWIGVGLFENKLQMQEQNLGYTYFNAFKTNNIYNYTNKMGLNGGFLYFELGPLRPDIILKDLIDIAHPGLLDNYENYFFKKLN